MWTYKTSITTLKPLSIGLDDFFNFAEHFPPEVFESKFPSYNIINVDNKTYLIEIALAGYKKEDIDITHENGVLTVSHVKPKTEASKARTIHNGITKKSFSKPFAVADSVIVESATFIDGLLTISLKDTTPEPKKNKIEIS